MAHLIDALAHVQIYFNMFVLPAEMLFTDMTFSVSIDTLKNNFTNNCAMLNDCNLVVQ
jgi:hypothetical protein